MNNTIRNTTVINFFCTWIYFQGWLLRVGIAGVDRWHEYFKGAYCLFQNLFPQRALYRSLPLTSTTASLLPFRTSLSTRESDPRPHTHSVRSQPRLSESGVLPFPAPYIRGSIRATKPFHSITWRASSLKAAPSCSSESFRFSRPDPLPACAQGEKSLSRRAFQAPGASPLDALGSMTSAGVRGGRARAHAFSHKKGDETRPGELRWQYT